MIWLYVFLLDFLIPFLCDPDLQCMPEFNSRTVSNMREDSDNQQGHQQQQQELKTRTLATAAETIGTSQTSTAEGDPQQ